MRQSLDDVIERCNVSITPKGTYVDPKKPPSILNDRKLYLLIEGLNEMKVKQAKLELQQMFDDELIRFSGVGGSGGGGRYSVI